jgi:hypothetical protein
MNGALCVSQKNKREPHDERQTKGIGNKPKKICEELEIITEAQ